MRGCWADAQEEEIHAPLPAVATGTTIPPPKLLPLNLLAYQPQGQCLWGPWVFLAPSPTSGKAPWLSTASPTCKESQPGNPAKRFASWQQLRAGPVWVQTSLPALCKGLPGPESGLCSPQPASPASVRTIHPPLGPGPERAAPSQPLPICISLAPVSPQWWAFRNPRLSTSLVLNELWVFGENGSWAAGRMTSLRASQKTRGAQATDRRQTGTLSLAETSGSRLGGAGNQRDRLKL